MYSGHESLDSYKGVGLCHFVNCKNFVLLYFNDVCTWVELKNHLKKDMESNSGCKIYDLKASAFYMSLMSAVLMLIDFKVH